MALRERTGLRTGSTYGQDSRYGTTCPPLLYSRHTIRVRTAQRRSEGCASFFPTNACHVTCTESCRQVCHCPELTPSRGLPHPVSHVSLPVVAFSPSSTNITILYQIQPRHHLLNLLSIPAQPFSPGFVTPPTSSLAPETKPSLVITRERQQRYFISERLCGACKRRTTQRRPRLSKGICWARSMQSVACGAPVAVTAELQANQEIKGDFHQGIFKVRK